MLVPQFLKSPSSTTTTLLSLLLLDGVQGQNSTQGLTGFPPCDALIAAGLSHAVVMPSSPLFDPLVASYWSINTRVAPWCWVMPSSPSEVAQTLTALRSAGGGAGDWHIAIRSGGHGSENSNNIQEGVTIDLAYLNTTTYDAATNVASFGSGSKWQSVYDELEKHEVSVTGGREGEVGVGGFILGGGNSWYTARTGFSCDSVVNYEIALSSGEIINANASAHSDLWRALKGGSSNFGIVTRFDMEAYPLTNLTLGTRTISIEHGDAFVDAVYEFANLDQSWNDNALLSRVSYYPDAGDVIISTMEVNTANDANSTAFDRFNSIPALTQEKPQSLTLAASADTQAVPPNTRNAGSYLTLANDKRVMKYALEQHAELVAYLNATIGSKNFLTILEFQPMPAYFAKFGVQNGGNMLGLEPSGDNKLFFVAGALLSGPNSAEQQPRVYQRVMEMNERITAFSRSIGCGEGFVYLNYAHAWQNPLGSYGPANVKYMKQVAKKYDPEGFFQSRVPGGFKISRVD